MKGSRRGCLPVLARLGATFRKSNGHLRDAAAAEGDGRPSRKKTLEATRGRQRARPGMERDEGATAMQCVSRLNGRAGHGGERLRVCDGENARSVRDTGDPGYRRMGWMQTRHGGCRQQVVTKQQRRRQYQTIVKVESTVVEKCVLLGLQLGSIGSHSPESHGFQGHGIRQSIRPMGPASSRLHTQFCTLKQQRLVSTQHLQLLGSQQLSSVLRLHQASFCPSFPQLQLSHRRSAPRYNAIPPSLLHGSFTTVPQQPAIGCHSLSVRPIAQELSLPGSLR